MHDVIVVGARCGGSPVAMLLARKGYKVLLVDKATFPSDTISTHIVWPHGAEVLDRWGLLTALADTGLPRICRRMSFDVGPFALQGTIPVANGGRGGFCPRRTVLDGLLVNAAAESGVEIREAFRVDALLFEGDAVVGIRGRQKGGKQVDERCRLVIGADGVHSFVADSVNAPEYDRRPIAGCAYYSYFSNVEQDDIELYLRDRCAFACAPTNDGVYLLVVSWPAGDFPAVRQDVEARVGQALALAPDFAARLSRGRREEKWYGTAGVPNYFRKPYGDGWALVGDAGYCRDPITAQGISDSFIDAEHVAEAVDTGFSGRGDLLQALAASELARNERVRPMYEFTNEVAALEPPDPQMQELWRAVHGDQAATDAFLSAITGATPIDDFMSPENVERLIAAGQGA